MLLTEEKPKIGQKYVAALRDQFGWSIQDESWQAPDQVTLTVDLNSLPAVVESLYYQHGGWLSVVAGNDERPLNGHFAMYYVLSVEGGYKPGNGQTPDQEAEKCYMVVRALIPPHKPEFPAVTPRVPAAIWYEREVRDMFGLQPVGLPDERRLVLPDDFPEGLYPLRKDTMDYRFRPEPVTEDETYEFIDVEGEGIVQIPLGTTPHDLGRAGAFPLVCGWRTHR